MSFPVALSITPETMTFAAAIAATGFSTSFIAGILGAGGGLIAIPVLQLLFMHLGLDGRTAMELTVGTMSCAMIMYSAAATLREARGARAGSGDGTGIETGIDWTPMRQWVLPVTAGVVTTHLIGLAQSGIVMQAVFAMLVLGIAAYMVFGCEDWRLFDRVPLGPIWRAMGYAFGLICSLVGTGGAVIAIPLMVACGMGIHRAITSSVVLGLMIGVPSALFYLQAPTIDLPGTVGYVNFFAAAIMVAAGQFGRPLGRLVQRHIPAQRLRQAFAAVLMVSGLRLCLESLLG